MKKMQKKDRLINEKLASFTDNILDDSFDENENLSHTDPELHALQNTVLRLKNVFPNDGPSDEAIQRMRQNVIKQWKKQEQKKSAFSWIKFLSRRQSPEMNWQSQRSRRRLQLAVFMAATFLLLFINSPAMSEASSGQPAASGQNIVFSGAIILSGFVVLVLWSYLRKG